MTRAPPAPPSRPIRVALFGYGLGGRSFHAPLIAVTPGLRLAAIVTSDAERQAHARREYPDAAIVARPEHVFENPADVDLVVISTPNRTHVPLALAAIDAGIGVVVDKPLAATSTDARRVIAAGEQAKVFLSVYQNRRWDGDFRTIRALIADGALGDVHRFESRFERWRTSPREGWRESAAPEDAGGLLFDLGTHLIDQALVLFGPAVDVYAELDRRRAHVTVDDDTFVALTHASGVRSHLWCSVTAAQNGPRFRVLGSRAAFTKFGMDVQEDALRGGERPDRPDWGEEPPENWGSLGVGDDHRRVPTQPGSYQSFYEGVVRSMLDGTPPPVDPRDALTTLEVIEAARRFARR